MTDKADKRRKPPSKHQPTKAEMEEVIAIPASLDELAGAVLAGDASRKEPEQTETSWWPGRAS